MEVKRAKLNHPNLQARIRRADIGAQQARKYYAVSLQRNLYTDISPPKPRAETKTIHSLVEQAAKPIIETFVEANSQLQEMAAQALQPAPTLQPVAEMSTSSGGFAAPTLTYIPHDDYPTSDETEIQKTVEKKPKKFKARILTILAIIVFISGMFTAISGYIVNHRVSSQINGLQQGSSSNGQNSVAGVDIPDETPTPAGAFAAYAVAPDEPRYVRIEKFNVEARVRSLGLNKKGEVDTPRNIYDAGWYSQTSKPSSAAGAILLVGHVSGPTKHGVFYDLKSLQMGDEIEIEQGNGTISRFRMVSRQVYAANEMDMAKALTPVTPGKLGLNLITCTGSFNPETNSYDQRILIQAEKI